jgi:tRNA A-37 threonylcarbamoyl transferase component Bud32
MRRRLYIHERYRDDLQAAGIADLHALRAFAQCGAVTSQASTLVVRRHVLAGYGTYAKLYGHGTLNPRYFLRASRAWRELRSYQYLDRIGLRHPDVICVAEQRRCGCPIWSVIVTREVAPAPNLAELFCRSPGDDTQRADVIRSLAEAVARMHNAGFYYRTLRFRNILLHTAPSGAGELYFIDCPTGHAWTGPMNGNCSQTCMPRHATAT